MAGSQFDDGPDELEDRIKAQFQGHGYFTASIQKLENKTVAPLASPKPVRLEAQITEAIFAFALLLVLGPKGMAQTKVF
jgi:hypothetical protein